MDGRMRGMTDEQLAVWARAHTGGCMESPVAMGVLRLLSEKSIAAKALHNPTQALAAAVAHAPHQQPTAKETLMAAPNPILDPLAAQVQATIGVEQSAITLIGGIQAQITAAVAAATAGGATTDQLAPFVALDASLADMTSKLAAAVAANPAPAPAGP